MELAVQWSHAIVGTVELPQVQVQLSWNRFADLCSNVIQPPSFGEHRRNGRSQIRTLDLMNESP